MSNPGIVTPLPRHCVPFEFHLVVPWEINQLIASIKDETAPFTHEVNVSRPETTSKFQFRNLSFNTNLAPWYALL